VEFLLFGCWTSARIFLSFQLSLSLSLFSGGTGVFELRASCLQTRLLFEPHLHILLGLFMFLEMESQELFAQTGL
jgi:hypothetical protein